MKTLILVPLLMSAAGCTPTKAYDVVDLHYYVTGRQVVLSPDGVGTPGKCRGAITTDPIRAKLLTRGPTGRARFTLRKISGPTWQPVPDYGDNIVLTERRFKIRGQWVDFQCESSEFFQIRSVTLL